MKHRLALILLAGLLAPPLLSPSLLTAQAPALTPRVAEILHRAANGHSPAPEDMGSVASIQTDASDLQTALPLLLQALDHPDSSVRAWALTALAGLQSPSEPAAINPGNGGTLPTSYKPATASILTPAIPRIASHLTEELASNRSLTATILGGFTPNPPLSVYPPLYAFLHRDDAIGQIGLSVVSDLLQLSPVSSDTAAAIAHYLRRSDQTPDSRSNLADAIASHPNQSQSLNKVLLDYLDSDDPTLRARIILSLPQLDLAPDVFTDTRTRISQLAENSAENLQVVNAAKAVAPCWTSIRMTAGCPQY